MKTAVRLSLFSLAATLVLLYVNCTTQVKPEIAIIPKPSRVDLAKGWYEITPRTVIALSGDQAELQPLAAYVSEALFPGINLPMPVREHRSGELPDSGMLFRLDEKSEWGDEGYELAIRPQGIYICANKTAGIFYAIQSLRQLSPIPPAVPAASNQANLRVPCLTIRDKPSFQWRGLMLDCSRTFLSRAYIFRYIDLLAMYKLNVLHLHLTDDQGWRLEIRKHPRLTEIGSRFASGYAGERNGYYSQQDIREIVEYAALRHITIVPEIEMPGHATALLAAYPELSCNGRKHEIFPFFQGPAVTRDILCAGNEAVFSVMTDVLAEVMELFPGRYIHVGGDEAPKERWQACPKCQQRLKEEGLHNEDELQSYFMRRIGDVVSARGRTMIGWDEILEGGLAANAAVMSWRSMKGGYEAAILDHEAVMSPTSHCYFDYDVKRIPMEKTYAFCPIPEGLPEEKAGFILGGQANMWTHIARTDSAIDRQIFPRLLALAEALWSEAEQKQFTDFFHRYESHEQRLRRLGVAVGPAAEPPLLKPEMDSLAHSLSWRPNARPSHRQPLLLVNTALAQPLAHAN